MQSKSKFNSTRRFVSNSTWSKNFASNYSKEYIDMKKIIISDCDGILTDGNMIYDDEKKKFKTYGCHDKEMYKLARNLGWQFIFVSNDKRGFNITDTRVHDFAIRHVCLLDGKQREDLVNNYKKEGYLVVFLGDSPSDLNAASSANICATTNNCFDPIKPYFNYVSNKDGGHGGFADIIYQLLLISENELKEYI